MTSNPFKGLGTALVTPFRKDGSVDLEAVSRLAKRQVESGVDMLIPCGTTGEAVTLSDEEYSRIVSAVVEAVLGKIPVIAGAGSNSTAKTIQTARLAVEAGADAVLVVGPYYNKPTQEGYYQHFKTVAEAVQLPMIIYNVPGRTAGNISAETQLRIAGVDSVAATKEASGNLSQIMHILREKPADFHVLSGDDNLVLPEIAAGIDGVISVISNEVPAEFSSMVHAALEGRFDEARSIHYRLLELMEVNFIESNPIPVKTAMAMMGLVTETFRLPLTVMDEKNRLKLAAVLKKLGLIKQ